MRTYQTAARQAAAEAVNRVAAEFECDSAEVRKPVRRVLAALGLGVDDPKGQRKLSRFRTEAQRAELVAAVIAGVDKI